MVGCKVKVIEVFDLDWYPGWCKVVLKDCNDIEHILEEKLPVIGLEERDVHSLPVETYIAVEVVKDLGDTVEIDTAVPYGIETQDGKTRFVVRKEMINNDEQV